MLNTTQKIIYKLMCVAIVTLLNACGSNSSSDASGSGDLTSTPSNVLEISVFEGSSMDIDIGSSEGELTWSQTSGPVVMVDNNGENQYTMTVPWLMTENELAEFEFRNGDKVIKRIRLEIKNRHFLLFRVENTDEDNESLFLKYVSGMGEQDIPTLEMVSLADTMPTQDICAFVTSPSGQYVAYSIRVQEEMSVSSCQGLYLVDVVNQITKKISPLNSLDNDIQITLPKWSPDGTKIAYKGTYVDGAVSQHYVYDWVNDTTTFINYANNYLASDLWPEDDLYSISDGGNPFFGTVSNPVTYNFTWLGNSNGVGFTVTDSESFGDYYPYIASIHGDARLIQRGSVLKDIIISFDMDEADNYNNDLIDCAAFEDGCPEGFLLAGLTINNPRFYNAEKLSSSIEGHFSFISNVQLNNDEFVNVLAVTPMVMDAQPYNSNTMTQTLAENVFDAAWSPKKMQIAFTGESGVRYRSDNVLQPLIDDLAPGIKIYNNEIPGQLYIYNNFRTDLLETQERLAYPRPDIDDNYVRKLSWSNSGDYIAYVRGEDGSEGDYFTSLWVTYVDEVRDESQDTIDANTVLLENIRDSDNYMTDFRWLPNEAGVLLMMQNNNEVNGALESRSIRYFPKDGSQSVDFTNLVSKSFDKFGSLATSLSPDGKYFAYRDLESTDVTAKSVIFIQSIAGGDRVKVNVPPEAIFSSTTPFWSPSGEQLVVSAQLAAGEFAEYFLVDVNGESQPLGNFFLEGQKIRRVGDEINSHINLIGLPSF